MDERETRVVRINISENVWTELRLQAIKIRKPAAYILGELAKRWLRHQKEKSPND